jgi:uncharacterized protein
VAADRTPPQATPETREFWDAVADQRLLLQRCTACTAAYFPPQPTCPRCAGTSVTSFAAAGGGRVYSSIVSHLSPLGFSPPYVLAVIELDEGPRLLAPIRGVDAHAELPLDAPVDVVFEDAGGTTVYAFRPRASTRADPGALP